MLLEIEEVVFDTLAMRAHALYLALQHEGVTLALDEVRSAHAGVTAAMALDAMPDSAALDVVTRDLVLLRATNDFRAALSSDMPSFVRAARDAVERLAAEFRIGVVSRAACDDAQRMLEQAGLDMCIGSLHSLSDLPPAEQRQVWSAAAARLHGGTAIAIGPRGILAGARRSGLLTIAIGSPATNDCAALVSLAQLDASFIASLPETPELF